MPVRAMINMILSVFASALASLDSLARTLEAQGRFAEAAEVLKGILERAPDERDSLFRYRSLLQNELGDTAGALALMESWTRRNPGDLLASVYLVENLFLSGRYEECVARARVSAQDPRMLAPEQVVVRAFELAALRLLGRSSEEITARLDQLLAGVVEMPEVFSTRWTFPAVERSLRDKSATVHRDWLLDLFRTAGADNRSTLVEGLHRLRADLESQQI